MRKKVLAFLVTLVILLAVGISATFFLSSTPEETSQDQSFADPIDAIRDLQRKGALQPAYDLAVTSFSEDPSRSDIAFEAGLLAVILRQPENAHRHMQSVWESGVRKLSVLLIIIDTYEVTVLERIEEFNRLFPELDQTPENLNAKGRFYSRYGLHDEALAIWQSLAEKTGDEAIILQMARKLEVIGRREEASSLLIDRQSTSQLSTEGYNLLLSLLVFDNQFDQAEGLIQMADEEDPHGEWMLKKAMFTLMQGRLPEAEDQLATLIQTRSEHPVALAVAHESRIIAALLRVIQNGPDSNLGELRALAAEEMSLFPPRTVTTPLLGMTANPKELEGEKLLYSFLGKVANGETPSNDLFVRIESFLRDSPAIRWLGIREAVTNGRPEGAVALYTAIEDVHPLERIEGMAGFFYKSPLFITEAARGFYQDNKQGEALTLLNHLHERELHSPTSIRLFAQVMSDTGQSTNPELMQQALGRQFKDDLGIQMTLANQAYQEGKTEEALEIVAPLIKANTENIEIRMVELMILLEEGQTEIVLEKLASENLPERNRNLVRARVALQNGETDSAESFFKQAIDPSDFFAYLDYARFLVDQQRSAEAGKLYREILSSEPDNIVALQGQSIIHELNGHPEKAVGSLRRVLNITPDDTYSQTRLAKLQLQTNQPRNALRTANKVLAAEPENADARYLQITAMIQLALEQSALAVQQRNLLEVQERMQEAYDASAEPQFFLYVYLAAAFRDTGLPDKSGEIYRELLAMDESVWKNTFLRRSDVQTALEALNE
ncbi:MAG: tetratricopeptide repeat protein [Verrucomicrobiota bacterium]